MKLFFRLQEAGVRYGDAQVLRAASFELREREFVAIAGPNGAGKSTLLSVMAGLLQPTEGRCLFLGQEAHKWNRRAFARLVALVRQAQPAAFPFTVEQIVYMGRMPHRTGMLETAEDHAAVDKALTATGTAVFRRRDFRTLSGGERQRVLLASALAQQPEAMLLDEPTTHLDLEHQLSLHRLLRDISREGVLVVAVTHDLNLAAAYADRLLVVNEGRICADGRPADVLDSGLIEEVFRVHVELHHRPSGQPWLLYGE